MTDIVPQQRWKQLENERDHEYAWFKAYLELGDTRTPAKAARRCGVPIEMVKAAANAHLWNPRALAYDAALVQLVELFDPDEQQALATQFAAGELMLRLAFKALESKNPALLNMKDITALLDKGAENMRRGAGVADIKVSHDTTKRVQDALEDWFGTP